MRALVVFALLLSVCAWVCVAAPNSVPPTGAKGFLATLLEGGRIPTALRSKRDACSEALDKLNEEPYLTCQGELGPILFDSPEATDEKVYTYCRSDCPPMMRVLFHEIELGCSGTIIPALDNPVTEICDPDPRGTPCGIDYISEFDSTMEAAFEGCITDFYEQGKGCTENCNTITQFIQENLGCCYTIVEQFLSYTRSDKEVDKSIFEACGRKEADPCSA